MPQTTTMTVRIPIEVKDRLERLARHTDRTKAFIAGKAIEDYLDAQEWQIEAISQAAREADAKDAAFMSHDEVEGMVRKKLASIKKRAK